MRAVGRKDHVVLAPDDECRRPARAEESLELRIERDVAAVVLEQVEHDLVDAGPVEQRLIVQPGVRCDPRRIAHPVEILGFRRGQGQSRTQRCACASEPSAQ